LFLGCRSSEDKSSSNESTELLVGPSQSSNSKKQPPKSISPEPPNTSMNPPRHTLEGTLNDMSTNRSAVRSEGCNTTLRKIVDPGETLTRLTLR
jgi:hypothetical protein